eukprot:8027382-Karenia_brevis.AAC.1
MYCFNAGVPSKQAQAWMEHEFGPGGAGLDATLGHDAGIAADPYMASSGPSPWQSSSSSLPANVPDVA